MISEQLLIPQMHLRRVTQESELHELVHFQQGHL